MSYKPAFNCTVDAWTGYGQNPPFAVLFLNEPCAAWHSRGRASLATEKEGPLISIQLAISPTRSFRSDWGWYTPDRHFDPALADWWIIRCGGGGEIPIQPVCEGPMWAGTADYHWRYSCCFAITLADFSTLQLHPPIGEHGQPLPGGRLATFDVYRPFGAAVPTWVAAPGVIYPDPYGGRNRPTGQQGLYWSDVLDCADTLDIRDGVLRNAGTDSTTYADGDEVRFPTGVAVTRYVVIKVTRVAFPDGTKKKRVYLVRDNPAWPGP